MVKAIEVIVVITLLVFAFFIGVKYSDSVKNHASWLFEQKEEEVELPDLSNETSSVEETVEISTVGNAQAAGTPMDDLDTKPAAAPAAAAAH